MKKLPGLYTEKEVKQIRKAQPERLFKPFCDLQDGQRFLTPLRKRNGLFSVRKLPGWAAISFEEGTSTYVLFDTIPYEIGKKDILLWEETPSVAKDAWVEVLPPLDKRGKEYESKE